MIPECRECIESMRPLVRELHQLREWCKILEKKVNEDWVIRRKKEVEALPKPDLRDASEFTRTDYFKGQKL